MSNLFLFTGSETYLLHEQLKSWKDAFLEKHGEFNLSVLDIKEVNLDEVLSAAEAMPFLGEKRLIIVHGLPEAPKKSDKVTKKDEKREEELKFFQKALKTLPESTILVLVQSNPDKRKSLYKFIKKEAEIKEFKALEGYQLTQWVQKEVGKRGGKISSQTADYLTSLVGADLWRLSSEISKLISYANGQEIDRGMVDQLSVVSFEANVFAFTDALAAKNHQKAIQQLHQIVNAGESLHPVFYMIARQFRLLLQADSWVSQNPAVDSGRFASELKIHPFVAKKTLSQVRSFEFDQLKKAHQSLLAMDTDLKTSRIRTTADNQDELTLAMERFILKVCQG